MNTVLSASVETTVCKYVLEAEETQCCSSVKERKVYLLSKHISGLLQGTLFVEMFYILKNTARLKQTTAFSGL